VSRDDSDDAVSAHGAVTATATAETAVTAVAHSATAHLPTRRRQKIHPQKIKKKIKERPFFLVFFD
jgi:hypothetical protein